MRIRTIVSFIMRIALTLGGAVEAANTAFLHHGKFASVRPRLGYSRRVAAHKVECPRANLAVGARCGVAEVAIETNPKVRLGTHIATSVGEAEPLMDSEPDIVPPVVVARDEPPDVVAAVAVPVSATPPVVVPALAAPLVESPAESLPPAPPKAAPPEVPPPPMTKMSADLSSSSSLLEVVQATAI